MGVCRAIHDTRTMRLFTCYRIGKCNSLCDKFTLSQKAKHQNARRSCDRVPVCARFCHFAHRHFKNVFLVVRLHNFSVRGFTCYNIGSHDFSCEKTLKFKSEHLRACTYVRQHKVARAKIGTFSGFGTF